MIVSKSSYDSTESDRSVNEFSFGFDILTMLFVWTGFGVCD